MNILLLNNYDYKVQLDVKSWLYFTVMELRPPKYLTIVSLQVIYARVDFNTRPACGWNSIEH